MSPRSPFPTVLKADPRGAARGVSGAALQGAPGAALQGASGVALQGAPGAAFPAAAFPAAAFPAAACAAWVMVALALPAAAEDCSPSRISHLDRVGAASGASPWSATAADLDGDLDLDLVSANAESDNLTVFFQQGGDVFQTLLVGDFGLTAGPRSVAVADLGGDENQDIVSANFLGGDVTVFLQSVENEQRVFTPAPGGPLSSPDSTLGPVAVLAVDVDGDGDADLAVANHDSGSISVFGNEGGGLFAPAADFGTGPGPTAMAAGDLDGDLSLDLVTVNEGDNALTVLLNDGSGSFTPTVSIAVGLTPLGVAAADLDGDGDVDIVTANHTSSSVSILWNRGRAEGGWRGFDAPVALPVAPSPTSVALADMEADGAMDVAVTCRESSVVQILPGRFEDSVYLLNTAPVSFKAGGGRPRTVHAAALPNEIPSSLVIASESSSEVVVLRRPAALPPFPPVFLVVGDVNDNGCPDDCEADCNGNEIPDDHDIGAGLLHDTDGDGLADECGLFHRGDANGDEKLDLSDAVVTLNYLFLGAAAPGCLDAADANDSGALDLSDAIFALGFLFLGGPEPPAPGVAACGPDPSGGTSGPGCVSYPACPPPPPGCGGQGG